MQDKMQGYKPHLMIVDEAQNVVDIETVDEDADGGLSVLEWDEQMDELRGLSEEDYEHMAEQFRRMSNAFVQSRISTGKAAAQMIGLAPKDKAEKPWFSKNQEMLHKKAVERRKKRKRGGHK